MTTPLFPRIAIIGLGLIGGSIARAARERNLASVIAAYDLNEISLAYGRKHGFIDIAAPDMASATTNSDLIVLATPPSALEDAAREIAPHLKPGCIVMDVCSVKQAAIAAIAPHMPKNVFFMPAHPIAGSEHAGVVAGRANLFATRRVVVTPEDPLTAKPFLPAVSNFWKAMGAKVEAMPPHLHDLVYAYVSHLPQLLAFASASIMDGVSTEGEEITRFLRLSHSDPDLWTDIFLLNRENLLKALDRYLDAIHHIIGELADAPLPPPPLQGEGEALFPRIAASCLITTVMEAEKKAGFPFAHYAGTGFADFTFPAGIPPEEDIEHISNHHRAVRLLLVKYEERLQSLRAAILSGDTDYILEPV